MAIPDKQFFDEFNADIIEKNDARIIWWIQNNRIIDFRSLSVKSQEDALRIDDWLFRSNKEHVEIGNCIYNWDEWSVGDVLARIVRNKSANQNVSEKILREICKIREFSGLFRRVRVWRL